jgi:RNA polymerase sigma-70 factor (ECF subfamily)
MNVDQFAIAAGRLNVTDEQSELVRRARRGELQAFEMLMRIHDRQVYRVALRMLGNVEDAKDASQEVFLRLHRSLGKVDETRDLASWLYRVTVNVCNDAFRNRRATLPIEKAGVLASAVDPEQESEANQTRRLVTEALARLPEKQRAAVVLREIEGLSTAEVAGILGASEMTVRSHISLARTKLRQWLAGRRT